MCPHTSYGSIWLTGSRDFRRRCSIIRGMPSPVPKGLRRQTNFCLSRTTFLKKRKKRKTEFDPVSYSSSFEDEVL